MFLFVGSLFSGSIFGVGAIGENLSLSDGEKPNANACESGWQATNGKPGGTTRVQPTCLSIRTGCTLVLPTHFFLTAWALLYERGPL